MDNEKYGIELELITDKFNKKIQQVKKDVGSISKLGFVNEDAWRKATPQQWKKYINQTKNVNTEVAKTQEEYSELNKTSLVTSDNMIKGFNTLSSKIKRFGLALLSIRSVYSLVSRASSAYLAQDTELANRLQNAWVALGSLFAPIIEKIVTVIEKAIKYIAIFIKALTGVDILAKATAKSMAGTTKSAKALSKALAGFDELTNLDTETAGGTGDLASGLNGLKDVQIDEKWADIIEKFAEKLRVLKGAWDTLNPTLKIAIGLLGAAGLLGILKGDWGLVGAIGAVAIALDGLNTMINGDTTDAIFGMIELIGGAGLAGALIGGLKGFSLGIAIASVITLLKGFSDLLSGDATKSVKGFIEVIVGSIGIVAAVSILTGGLEALNIPLLIAVGGFVALVAGIVLLSQNWSKMNGFEKAAAILGTVAIAAAAAAAAVGALQSAWSLGIAAIAIVAGITAIAAAVSSANKTAKENLPQYDVGTNYVPQDQVAMIHKGEAIIPKKFNSQQYFSGSNDETNELLQQLITRVENIELNPYITVKDIGKASLSYINNKSRQLGESVVV